MKYQESEGLLSSRIRNVRLSRVAEYVKEKSIVLDLACGAGHLMSYLPSECQYFGVDRIPMDYSHERKFSFLNLNLLENTTVDVISRELQVKADCIACIAFLEHISDPTDFLSRYKVLLKKGGIVLGTTPHPRGRIVHDILSSLNILSKEAAQEHEEFFGKKKIEKMALDSGGQLIVYEQFLFGMNQLFVIKYP